MSSAPMAETSPESFVEVDPEDFSLFDDTVTPMTYRDRITVELILNGTSWILNFLLFLFVRYRRSIWNSLKSTIVFVTTGSLIINIPLLLFQSWMVINLQFGHEPVYSIFLCSFFKNVASSTTSAYQVLPFAVSLYRYRTVVLKRSPSNSFVIYVQIVVTSIFILFAFLNYPIGNNIRNDVCYILRFSNEMEAVRMYSTLFFNILSIIVNCVIMNFVTRFKKENGSSQTKRVQLTQSLLIQSCIPVLVSLPLLLGSLEFYFGVPLPHSFASTWYATTFLGPFLTPFSSIVGIQSTRRELFTVLACGCFPGEKPRISQKSVVTVIVPSVSPYSTFTIRDDE